LKILDWPLLLDENLADEVAAALAAQGLDVVTTRSLGLAGVDDSAVIAAANEAFLRPGSLRATTILEMLQVLATVDAPRSPFVVVVRRKLSGQLVVRVRPLSSL